MPKERVSGNFIIANSGFNTPTSPNHDEPEAILKYVNNNKKIDNSNLGGPN